MLSINGREISLRAYCSQFNFRSGDQQARAAAACCNSTVSCFLAAPGLQRPKGSRRPHAPLCVHRRRWACSLVASATAYSSPRYGPVTAVCGMTHQQQVAVSAPAAGRLTLEV